jgi:C-terminal processing protease CtpA/Prc
MLAGVGPILGEGEVGAFLDNAGGKTKWFYENGVAGVRTGDQIKSRAKTSATPVTLIHAPVAVLIDKGTGSSGEAIAVAFRGRLDTRFFGQPTYGVSNSTFPYDLSDGAQLFLVIAVDLDRDGNEYDSGVKPDEIVPVQSDVKTDDVALRSALRWLAQQRNCLVAQ